MVPYEDLPDEDKDVIGKGIEEFQNKCLLSYTKTRDNKVIQKYPLPRGLMHGQSDTNEADDRRFFVEAINKSVHDAMLNHNTAFLNTFHNTMKEVFHGIQLIRLDRLITTFHIHRLRGQIKSILAIKKQYQLRVMMPRQFRIHLSKFRVLLLIKCNIILDHQCRVQHV